MARYLGAQTSLRFNVRSRPYARYRQWRIRLLVAATLFLLIGLWGMWREFLG